MSQVTLSNLTKNYGSVEAVKALNLEIQEGEFFSLLGPSGCGKTTTLRMIAGFEFPAAGHIRFDGRDVTFLKPNLRNAGMVFQNFALFPHMTVFENVAFGLRARKVARSEISVRVQRALQLVELGGLSGRQVTQLSGGQQQRVALARAVVIEPGILLLDEPLSNLDAKLREETREEIRRLQRRLGITTIYVTHDQEEALNLSDNIAVMNGGICQQVGSPEDIYQRPANEFVANFVGNSNIVPGQVVAEKGGRLLELGAGVRVTAAASVLAGFGEGQAVAVSIRPENVLVMKKKDSSPNTFAATVVSAKLSGAVVDSVLDVAGVTLRARDLMGMHAFGRATGAAVFVRIHPESIHLFPRE